MVEKLLQQSIEEIKKENSDLIDEQTKLVESRISDKP